MSGDVETMKTYTEVLPNPSAMRGEGVCKGSLKELPSLETQEDPKPLKIYTPPLSLEAPPWENSRGHHSRNIHKIRVFPKHTMRVQFLAFTVALGRENTMPSTLKQIHQLDAPSKASSIIKLPSWEEDSRLAETHIFQKQKSQTSCGMSTPPQWEQKASTFTSQMASVGREGTGWTPNPSLTCSWIGVLGWRPLLWEMHLSFACKTSLSDWWTCPRAERNGTSLWNIATFKRKYFTVSGSLGYLVIEKDQEGSDCHGWGRDTTVVRDKSLSWSFVTRWKMHSHKVVTPVFYIGWMSLEADSYPNRSHNSFLAD